MRLAYLVSWSLLITSDAVLASPVQAEGARSTAAAAFPVRFRGDWYHEPGPCDRDPERLALHVGPTLLNYFDEFEGRLRSILHQSRRSIRYQAEYSADGRRWKVEETLRLSPKGNEMTPKPERMAPRYFRCTPNSR
jgi:hypothetical protein